MTHSGRTTLDELKKARSGAVVLLRIHGWNRVLVDAREITPEFFYLDLYPFIGNVEKNHPKNTRIAVIGPPDPDPLNEASLAAAEFTDAPLIVFHSEDEAVKWLIPEER